MDVVNYFNEGRKNIKSGDFKNAINSFNECIKGNKNDDLSKTYIDRCNQLLKRQSKRLGWSLGYEK